MDERIGRLEGQLKASALRIETLENRVLEGDYKHLLVRLKAKYAVATEKLKELKEAGNESWEFYKADIWIAWYELENALRDVQQVTLQKKEK